MVHGAQRPLNGTAVFVGLGSNLGRPHRQVARAIGALRRLPGVTLVAVSAHYASAPVGCPHPQPDYTNAVAVLRTTRSPRAFLAALHAIERRQQRDRSPGSPRNAARTLDLDLLLYGRRRLATPVLTVPHPRLHERAFVLRPLVELAPAASVPGRGLARAWLRTVRDQRITRRRHPHRF